MSTIIFAGQLFLELLAYECDTRGVQYGFRRSKFLISVVSCLPKGRSSLYSILFDRNGIKFGDDMIQCSQWTQTQLTGPHITPHLLQLIVMNFT